MCVPSTRNDINAARISCEMAARELWLDRSSLLAPRDAKIEGIDGYEITDIVLPDDDIEAKLWTADLNVVGKLYSKSYRDPSKQYESSRARRMGWDQGSFP
ncbi:hypothetical protein V8E54_005007 [Elaphomyces granulatus]